MLCCSPCSGADRAVAPRRPSEGAVPAFVRAVDPPCQVRNCLKLLQPFVTLLLMTIATVWPLKWICCKGVVNTCTLEQDNLRLRRMRRASSSKKMQAQSRASNPTSPDQRGRSRTCVKTYELRKVKAVLCCHWYGSPHATTPAGFESPC